MREEVQNAVRSKIRENLRPVSFVSAICITNCLDRETTDYVTQPKCTNARRLSQRNTVKQVSNFLRGRELRKTSRKCPFRIRVSINRRTIRQTFDRRARNSSQLATLKALEI